MIQWQIKALAKKCAVSGENFRDGDKVVCVIVKTPAGTLERVDILEKNLPLFSFAGTILGRWTRVFASNSGVPADQQQRLASQEEFFLSLFGVPATDEGDLMKQLLALLLERKRILRMRGNAISEQTIFVHVRTKTEFSVPMKSFAPEEIAAVSEVLENLVA